MMTLPTFTDPDITTNELLTEQARLHTQADKLLSTTGLLDIFGQYGTVSPIEGSYGYGLMVYPDLDMQVITDHQFTKQEFAKMVGEFAEADFVRGFSVADRANFAPINPGRPTGYWLGLDIPFDDDRWGIDLWVQTPEQASGDSDKYKEKLSHLTSEQVAAILAIKYHLIREGLYGKKYLSVDVYDVVVDREVMTYDDFNNLHQ
jgi:hypothetical protein